MFAVVVTGPPGSGKSTVTGLLHDVLGDSGVAVRIGRVIRERGYLPSLL